MKAAILVSVAILGSCAAAPVGEDVEYDVDGDPYEGYMVRPSKEAPLVLLVHDWDGLTGYEKKRAHMLSDLGYTVFAADLFGKGIRPTEIADKRKLTGALYKDRDRFRSLLRGALRAAERNGGKVSNAVAMGYCFGGTAVLELARAGAKLKGFVAFHGGLSIPEGQDYSKTNGRLLILHGTADAVVTMEEFAQLAKVMEKAEIPHEMITYSGAPHAFSVFGSERYRKEADRKSWKRFTEFLGETLGR
ncbi:MAG: dienelactone hydrolase family protein [Planctomycetota bacterium]